MEKISNRIIAVVATIVSLFLAVQVTGIGLEKFAASTPVNETIAAALILFGLVVMTTFSALVTIDYFKGQAARTGKLSR
ncbi:MAG: hypothetical protein ACR2MX_16125 [Cyclobacteriaceae bacterium]